MTEREWLACADPGPMLLSLQGRAGNRKIRLFAVACCRRVWHLLIHEKTRSYVEVAEKYADGRATVEELVGRFTVVGYEHGPTREALGAARCCTYNYGPDTVASAQMVTYIARLVAGAAGGIPHPDVIPPACAAGVASEQRAQAGLLRDIFGPLPFRAVAIHPAVLAWSDRLVVRLAQSIYDQRSWSDMPLLSDALLDAGCDEQEVLDHCRWAGPHTRGCWALDLLLKKE